MVCKIGKSRSSMRGPLKYNEDKVKREVASLLGTFNVPGEGAPDQYRAMFNRLERRNGRTANISFQMSINPNPARPEESLTDPEALSYAKKLMEGLGYGDQPIVVFKHFDIQRVHYHVVSIRTRDDGRKIKDGFEERKLQRLMKQYAKEYRYLIGNQGIKASKDEKAVTVANPSVGGELPRFNPKGANVKKQFDDLFNVAMTYEFRNENQFRLIMEGLGVEMDWLETEDGYKLTFQGLDDAGKKASAIVPESDMGIRYYDLFARRCEECSNRKYTKEQLEGRKKSRRRTAFILRKCIEYSRNENHLNRMLAHKGLALRISRTADGDPFGGTVVDHSAQRAYKVSTLDRALPDLIKETAQPGTGRWDREAAISKEEWVKKMQAERKERRIQSNMDLAAKQAAPKELKPVHKISGKDRDWISFALGLLEAILTQRITVAPLVAGKKKKKEPVMKRKLYK